MCGPSRNVQARLFGDVGKGAVAIIVIEDVPSIASHIEVHPTIAVVISGRGSHAKNAARHSSLIRYIRKRAVVVIVIERVLQRRLRRKKIRWATVDEINVHPTIVVVIKEEPATAARFG